MSLTIEQIRNIGNAMKSGNPGELSKALRNDVAGQPATRPNGVAELRASYEQTIKETSDPDGKPVHYLDRLGRERAKDPVAFDKKYDDLLDAAQNKTKCFMDSVRNFDAPDHASAVATYQNKYNCDKKKVYDDSLSALMPGSGAKKYEARNLGYESNLINGLTVSNEDEAATFNSLRDLMQKKHFAIGYDGDAAVIDQFKSENLPLRGTIKNARP